MIKNYEKKGVYVLNSLEQYRDTLANFAKEDGLTESSLGNVGIFKSSMPYDKSPALYQPFICLAAQGEKYCHVGDSSFYYSPGKFFINFLPSPVFAQVTQATPESPFLTAALEIDLMRLADLIIRIEREVPAHIPESHDDISSMVVGEADDRFITLFQRLIETAFHPQDSVILGSAVVDEIYYRLLTSQHGYALRMMLNQYGQIQPISKAVNFIHDNMSRTIQVDELAQMANMSKSGFFAAFKKLMHVPPLQYIKSTKLQTAQAMLKRGMRANEACYQVGYNNVSQFSREYKRLFGFSPSETQHF